MSLSRRHRRTLDRIREDPPRTDVRWKDVEAKNAGKSLNQLISERLASHG